MITAYYNCTILDFGQEFQGKAVLTEGDKIIELVDENNIPETATKIDLKDAYLSPSLIDLQIYGTGGLLFGGKPTVEALKRMEVDLLAQGTTGFLATVATNSNEIVEQAIEAAKAYRPQSNGVFLGLHLEGPYLNAKRRGAHPEKFVKPATLSEVKGWVEKAAGEIKMITIAPELQSREVMEYLHENNIVISCGHSDATYDEALSFLNNPVDAATHLFNAMPPIHHREPGLIPAIFETKPYASIIADGIHVNFAMIKLAKEILGDKLFFITDTVTDTNEGIYQHVFTGDRYTMPDGTLSGSALTMIKSVANAVTYAGISIAEAVNMSSLYPARLIKSDKKGRIQAGYDADLIAFDKNFSVQLVSLMGIVQ